MPFHDDASRIACARQHAWTAAAIRRIEADFNRSADTHLIPLALPGFPGIDIYFKDESSHPTGSLKHRLARSLFLYALANGWLHAGSTVVEASSGSTAVSEAYFARLLGLPFVAVMPASTSPEKIAAIEFHGGRCHLVRNACDIAAESERLARGTGGHFMDQFTYAERATDWRANNNIAESIFRQMEQEPHPVPAWIVCSAGTGGTSATIGRYARYRGLATRVLCVDPEYSAFHAHYAALSQGRTPPEATVPGSRIEGIGRPTIERSFIPGCVDAMVRVPDALSLAAMRHVNARLGRRVGGSTGTNFVGVLRLAQAMRARGEQGSIVTILCDGGERYAHSYYDPEWYAAQGIDVANADRIIALAADGEDALPDLEPVSRHVDGVPDR
ncbi:PLP-dependent cysteine synthase family protein [Luteimonas viscosa]|uniref:L-cysteine desulfhydrase Cds1 n=1 Tax=Luteimonas viscosa TaxID=1132694 RepID=A0A5D4XHY1_9GAMM|nr:PLP-dependent cysteine synthase family protein [Luteimonas viscosa]TYT23563.1 PLP-dependent cysteine synthase family protein [Luteimonas viscosa]